MEINNDEKLVIYFSSGAMAGVFSAGVSKAFSEYAIKEHVDCVYGNSAGALTALYYLSDQVYLGAPIYWEDLNGEKYIRWSRLVNYVLAGFSNYFFGTKKEAPPVFDIDYIQSILETTRKINFQTIKKTGIRIYFMVYNLVTSRHEYLELKEEADIFPMLRATAGGHPAYPHASNIHGNLYVDGGTIDDEERIINIVKRHPDKEIICVLNTPKPPTGKVSNLLNRISISLVMLPFFGLREAIKTAKGNFSTMDVEKLSKDHPSLHFIANDILGYQMSTDAMIHKMLYKRGYELGKEFILSDSLKNYKLTELTK